MFGKRRADKYHLYRFRKSISGPISASTTNSEISDIADDAKLSRHILSDEDHYSLQSGLGPMFLARMVR